MPIYEFYCGDCHRIYSFFARTMAPAKRPTCPRCGRRDLEPRMSRFAISASRGKPAESDSPVPDVDESKMERAMEELAQEAEGMDENDPRQIARMMRKLSDSGAIPFDAKMEQAIRRLEAGEDPETVEADMGDLLGEGADEIPPGQAGAHLRGLLQKPPEVDDTLYDL